MYNHIEGGIAETVEEKAARLKAEPFVGPKTPPPPPPRSGPLHYFYMFYDSTGQDVEAKYKDAYYKLGVSTGEEWAFVIVDDPTDNRVRDGLKYDAEGLELYQKIRRRCRASFSSTVG